ncbi:uncharacterized protein LOC119687229 [Teleopsis dalmanni]|uniref:uncharacterized protein LOC119687229 n=1 Tax=Teleopsis dalmanni TaxID=139649 RepID=UPI000D32AC8D|nr:uncharacterized protein LOC119687229 [Teleopsis dalmanni]
MHLSLLVVLLNAISFFIISGIMHFEDHAIIKNGKSKKHEKLFWYTEIVLCLISIVAKCFLTYVVLELLDCLVAWLVLRYKRVRGRIVYVAAVQRMDNVAS